MNLRDPKGYYIALGIDESANADAIKSAYRSKAKRLHPDFNPSPIAAKQFHRLHEAYETLSDPEKRAAYDRPWRNEGRTEQKPKSKPEGSSNGTAYARRGETHKSETKADSAQEAPHAKTESAKSDAKAPSADQPATCKCGKVTAQPRYVIFDLVWGRLNHVQKRGVAGVYCRSCADRTAVRSSLLTWVAGWWAWPNGPKETVKALINNIRGGRKPPERNARLLMRQARAFRARGEMELARSAAEQAMAFAATPTLRHEVDSLLLSLSAHPARPLKDRWAKPGWAATVQLLPPAVVVGVLSMSVTLLSPTSLTALAKSIIHDISNIGATSTAPARPAVSPGMAMGRVFSVSAKQATLRTGPGTHYQVISVLPQGTIVLMTEADPGGTWLRVTVPDGASGFMAASQLSAEIRLDTFEEMGSKQSGTKAAAPAATDEAEP